ncbi:ABC-2 type transport system ATP-binding protein [Desulfitobacterium sp. LBE]|uniref:ABC transporter ATP-binding protein n=1 Tax=Desulfitobacterium sp. LBE TaxID=884086 RepID=UPI00119C2F0B|nr:ABC transporter ATP-binding protein [Desulfitobacterium sp. LBE]TWH56867.1 ABC-2 type transport system ATP-binding protein [Desulfitobacterium sp. LBE]
MSEFVIQTWNLTKHYDGKAGCSDVSLQVPPGVVYGFIGPNGAGKSTFVRTLLGLIHPTSGRAEILGHPLKEVKARAKVGYLPELFRYPDWLTGVQLLELHGDLAGVPSAERRLRIQNLVERVGLSGREQEKIRRYSKGMQQRIGLACALISDPELIFLDEPTSALDPIGRRDVRDLILALRKEGKTVFLNSHLLAEVENVCDQVAIINQGKVVAQGDWRTLCDFKSEIKLRAQGLTQEILNTVNSLVQNAELLSRTQEISEWRVQLSSGEAVPELIYRLSGMGIGLYEVVSLQPHLEEVFMYWVERKEREHAVHH